jgi:hypothetical protein
MGPGFLPVIFPIAAATSSIKLEDAARCLISDLAQMRVASPASCAASWVP